MVQIPHNQLKKLEKLSFSIFILLDIEANVYITFIFLIRKSKLTKGKK